VIDAEFRSEQPDHGRLSVSCIALFD
jgi:hypothetical protein